jgi:hypothetical protein
MQRNNSTCLYKITQQEVVEDEGNSGPGQPPLSELMVCLRKCEKQSTAISKNRLTAANLLQSFLAHNKVYRVTSYLLTTVAGQTHNLTLAAVCFLKVMQ